MEIEDIEKVIEEAQDLLLENKEWEKRFEGYADEILEKSSSIGAIRSNFREYGSLRFCISTSKVKDINSKTKLKLSIRYRGQNVADLKVKAHKDVKDIMVSTKDYNRNNKLHFNCDIELNNEAWRSAKVKEFRKYFRDKKDGRNDENMANEEQNVQDLLLSKLKGDNKGDKPIRGIQPVRIGKIRFEMPTPISASDHKKPLKYSGKDGGTIDILARTGNGENSKLVVVEVKDGNGKNEPPKDALKQAIQYAVFIRELLRSESGDKWYNVFGCGTTVPDKLTIRVASAMPYGENEDTSFGGKCFAIGERDVIECHYIYFDYDKKKLSNIKSSLQKED